MAALPALAAPRAAGPALYGVRDADTSHYLFGTVHWLKLLLPHRDPSDRLLVAQSIAESLQRAGLAGTLGQALVGEKHQHLQMLHFYMLLQQAEGFSAKAAVETSIGMLRHLQEHHRQRFAAAGVLAGLEHTIGMVGHLFEARN